MSEEPKEEDVSGRLRAEDRRGRVYDHFHGDNRREEEVLPPPDPEVNWVDEDEEKSNPWLMRGLSAVIMTVLIGVIAYSMQEPEHFPQSRSEPPTAEPSFLDSASPEEIEQEAQRVITGFMNSTTHRKRCQFILDGDKRLLQVKKFYQRPGFNPPESFGGRLKVEPYSIAGEALYVGLATGNNAGEFWPFHLRPHGSGFLIDWEASVSFGELSWDQFLDSKPNTPVQMRVSLTGILAPPELAIADEKFRTFEVSFREKKSKVLISLERGSPVEKELAAIVPRSVSHPLNLLMRWGKGDSKQSKLEILKVLHNYWVTPRS